VPHPLGRQLQPLAAMAWPAAASTLRQMRALITPGLMLVAAGLLQTGVLHLMALLALWHWDLASRVLVVVLWPQFVDVPTVTTAATGDLTVQLHGGLAACNAVGDGFCCAGVVTSGRRSSMSLAPTENTMRAYS
jgi:hypothetical protein